MTFLYYIPTTERITSLEQLADFGLSYAFDEMPDQAPHSEPANKPGIIFSRSTRPAYFNAKQTWRQIPAKSANNHEVWVGFNDNARPTSTSLSRPQQLPGHPVKMDDGSNWMIVAARRWANDDGEAVPLCALPPKLSFDDEGNWGEHQVKDRYAILWDLAREYESAYASAYSEAKEAYDGPDGGQFTFTIAFDKWTELAVEALKINYYVSDVEIDQLGIMDYESRKAIVGAVIDEPTWRSWSEKKTSDQGGLNSSNGLTASTPEADQPTPPPSQT